MAGYVVFDLEMCRVPKKKREVYGYSNEIIEIGAVLLDENLEIADSFMTYVSPEYGVIDSFIEKLTGISAEQTIGAPTIKRALEMFLSWMPEDAMLVTWSENDALQLMTETELKGTEFPDLTDLLDNSVDCQITFSEKMHSPKTYGLKEALIIADIEYNENIHDALTDAHNTALLFAKMQKEHTLKLTPYYTGDKSKKSTYNPFVYLLEDYA